MKPIDFRLATYESLQERINDSRAGVLAAWRKFGPGTTAVVAEAAGISILTLRPRSTELFQLGFICLNDLQPYVGEGVYRAREATEIIAWCAARRAEATERQTELALGARCA
jgi:hypothetical protein